MTLNEILITVVIISIIGTFAVETYVRSYEKGRGYNAVAILRVIRSAERLYYMDWNQYVALPVNCGSDLVTAGYLLCPNEGSAQDRGFDYTITPGGGNGYTAYATRTGGRYRNDDIRLGIQCCPESVSWGGSWPAEWRPQ